jgi:hypothetical protein
MVSPSYFPATPFGAIAHRLAGTLAPPWWVVRQRGRHEWNHRLIPTHRLGFWLVSAVLVGMLFWSAHRSGVPRVMRSASQSHVIARGRAEDYPVAKEMYSRVISVKSQSSEIVFRGTA